jgi:hypothetical protein
VGLSIVLASRGSHVEKESDHEKESSTQADHQAEAKDQEKLAWHIATISPQTGE